MTAPSRFGAPLRLALTPALVLVTAAGVGAQVPAFVSAPRSGAVASAGRAASVADAAPDGRGPVAGVTLARRDAGSRQVPAGSTFSTALVVANAGPAPATLHPVVQAPPGWGVVTGQESFALAVGETDPWIVALHVPSSAAAGDYVVPVAARVGDAGSLHDSLRVTVPVRRALTVDVARRPDYAVSGRSYELRFTVANRGNAPARAAIRVASSSATPAAADAGAMELAPGESRQTVVHVVAGADAGGTVAELVELTAVDVAHDSVRASATAVVTLVGRPGAGIARFATVPAELRLRAPGPGVAVSHAELVGGGTVVGPGGTPTSVDFLARAPVRDVAGGSSFYERDEYRVRLRTPNLDFQLGDGYQAMSALTGGGLPGFGARADVRGSAMGGGVYAHEARWSPAGETERGAYLAAHADGFDVRAHVVERGGGSAAGRVASVQGALELSEFARVAVEVGHGTGERGAGVAVDARVAGRAGPLDYDVGRLHADRAFAGPMRGAASEYLTADLRVTDELRLGVSAVSQRNDFGMPGVPAALGFRETGMSASLFDRVTLAVERSARAETFGHWRVDGTQEVARVRAMQPLGRVTVTGTVEAGTTADRVAGTRDRFHSWGLAADVALAAGHRVGAFVDVNDGRALTRRGPATTHIGLNADAPLPFAATLRLAASGTRPDDGGGWRLWTDATAERRFRSGDAVRLRLRQIAQPAAVGRGFGGPQYYLEYSRALRVPAGRAQTPGAARGRVTDAATGHGVAGALVRLGDRAAVTDDEGWATFVGLAPGQHALRLDGARGAGALVAGDQFVRVEDAGSRATTFAMAVARGARVVATVRRMEVARTGLGGAADSLADAGAVEGMLLLLAGERDTLVQATRADGTVDFGDVVPGRYALLAANPPASGSRLEPGRVEVDAIAGATHDLALRVLPRAVTVRAITPVEVTVPVVGVRAGARVETRGAGSAPRPAVVATAADPRSDAATRSGGATPPAARRPWNAPDSAALRAAVPAAAAAAALPATSPATSPATVPATVPAAVDGVAPLAARSWRDALPLLMLVLVAFALAVAARRLVGPRR